MDHVNTLPISIGAMSDMRIIISCVDYNHEILSVSDFQEQVVEQLIDFYHQRLCQNLAVVKSLVAMGITQNDIKQNRIGLCDRTLHQHVASSRTFEGASVRGVLEVHGLIRPSGHEELRGCIVVPLHDENGLIAGIFGKRLAQYIRRNGRRYSLWLATQNSINTLVFPSVVEVLRYE
jgi:hypothetical protein